MSLADHLAVCVDAVMTNAVDVVQKAAHILEVTERREADIQLSRGYILNEKGE